jgi:nuclear transport factor 2 (NTF2) superfamily protein
MFRKRANRTRSRQRPISRIAKFLPRVERLEERQLLSVSPYAHYDIGTPAVTDLWVDAAHGNDGNSGASRAAALRTISAAWDRVPSGGTLATTGYRIMLAAGTYTTDAMPTWWDDRHGTYEHPIIIQAADGDGTATLAAMDVHDVHFMYLVGLRLQDQAIGGNVLHVASSDHILIRNTQIIGTGDIAAYSSPQESLKINQTQYVYVEDSEISGAFWAGVDYVAVQYGHVIGSKIHHAGDWAMYFKGGSAYINVEGNELYDAGTGGFSAGQGTGFSYMVSPWLHYEAYDIKVTNNIIHDTEGAGLGVNGGYNIFMAYNTLYRVGSRDHVIEVVHGLRSAGDNPTQAAAYLAAGGWGTTSGSEQPIPNKHVYIYDNIVYNPTGYQSAWQHFAIQGAATPSSGTNTPNPSRADDDVQIRGNIIWNGPADLPLGVEDMGLSVTAEQLRADNAINLFEPQLVDAVHGDFRPLIGGNVETFRGGFVAPDFSWVDAPTRPVVPAGDLSNAVAIDRAGNERTDPTMPGAYCTSGVAPRWFTLSGPTSGSYVAGSTVTITWTAGGVHDGDTVSLCYDRDGIWGNGNETWIEVGGVVAADGSGSYRWNTTGVAPGTSYIGGYVGTTTEHASSHLTRSITIVAPPPPTFKLTGPTAGRYTAGQNVTIVWTASNVVAGSKVSLCYDKDTTWWNRNETWIEVDQVAAANGTGRYVWNTTGIRPGTYYIAGYLWQNGKPTFSHLTRSITIVAPPPPTFKLTGPTSGSFHAGQSVTIAWTASNVAAGSKVSLCYDRDTTWWNGNETWIEVDCVTAANGTASYVWDTTGVRPGTYTIAGYLWQNDKPTFSHLLASITILA